MISFIDLDVLRALHTSPDMSIKDKETEHTLFPMRALLMIYEKANYQCYIDYMEGFKLLSAWLSPIAYPSSINIDYYKSNIMYGYEVQEIAKILNASQAIIVGCVIEEVLPRMNATNALEKLP